MKRTVIGVVASLALLGLLALYFWVLPTSVSGWLVLAAAGIPAWFFLEWLGVKVLNDRFFTKLPSAARVLLGVPVVLVVVAFAAALASLVRHLALTQ
jgi:cytochrome b561